MGDGAGYGDHDCGTSASSLQFPRPSLRSHQLEHAENFNLREHSVHSHCVITCMSRLWGINPCLDSAHLHVTIWKLSTTF